MEAHGGDAVTVSQVIAIVALLAQVYGVDPALMDCIVAHESDYNVNAVSGVHECLCQFKPTTRDWLAGKAASDPAWLHGGIAQGPVKDVALAAWAIRNGFGSHWQTFAGCGGVE